MMLFSEFFRYTERYITNTWHSVRARSIRERNAEQQLSTGRDKSVSWTGAERAAGDGPSVPSATVALQCCSGAWLAG
jgi:hypothetical protein